MNYYSISARPLPAPLLRPELRSGHPVKRLPVLSRAEIQRIVAEVLG